MTTVTADFTRPSTSSRFARAANGVIAEYIRTLATSPGPETTQTTGITLTTETADLPEPAEPARMAARSSHRRGERRGNCGFPARLVAEVA